MIFKWSGDDEDQLPVPIPPLPTFETQEPVEYSGEDITQTPGVKYIETPSSSLSISPTMMHELSLDDVLKTYSGSEELEDAQNAATVARRNPMAYLAGRYMKETFYDPITGWVLDNEVMGNPERIIYFFNQYSRRTDPQFEPYIHEGAKFLIENDPLVLLDASNTWEKSGVAHSLARHLPNLFEAIVRVAESDEKGQLFAKDLNTQSKFQKLGRRIGMWAQIGDGKETERYKNFFLDRVVKVLKTRIAIEMEKYKQLLDKGADPKSPMMRKFRGAVQGWRNNLGKEYIKLTGGRSLHEANMNKGLYLKIAMRLAKVATVLDVKGQHELATELDAIAADWERFVDLRPKEEREKDPTDKGWEPHGVFKELKRRPGEEDERRYMVDPMFGTLEEAPEGTFVEEEWEPKNEEDVDRETDVEELSEEDLDTGYLVNTKSREHLWNMEDYGPEGQFIDKLRGE